MQNSVPKNLSSLKERIQRFFCASPDKPRSDVVRVIRDVEAIGEVAIFGGMVREIAFSGLDNFQSDVDIVIDTQKSSDLEKALSKFSYKKNKFGGYRILNTKWAVDIWPLRETWAFKKRVVQFKDISSLLRTTFFNWDSVVYNYSKRQLLCEDDYLGNLRDGHLAINLAENPNPAGAAIRTLRFLSTRNAKVSKDLAEFSFNCLYKYSADDICKIERQSFITPYLDTKLVQEIFHGLKSFLSSSEAVFNLPNPQKDLFEHLVTDRTHKPYCNHSRAVLHTSETSGRYINSFRSGYEDNGFSSTYAAADIFSNQEKEDKKRAYAIN